MFTKINKNNKNKNKMRKRNRNKNSQTNFSLAPLNRFSNFENYGGSFVDPHKFITLKYADNYSSSLATVTGSSQVMNLNSIFDPDRTGVGHQPYGYDQLALLYNRYRVWRCGWRINFHAEAQGFYIVVLPSNGALATAITNQASYALACESPRSQVRVQGTGGNSCIITGSIALNDLNGTTQAEYKGDDRFQALFGASPTELILLNIGIYNGTGVTVAIDYQLTLYFDVELHDPFMLAQS